MKTLFSLLLITMLCGSAVDAKNLSADILVIRDDQLIISEEILYDISVLGYTADAVSPEEVSENNLNQYQLVILSCGNNYNACRNSDMRLALQNFITEGGKVIIEGGDNGYISDVYPFYLGFRNKVLKIVDWVAHEGGNLNLNSVYNQSELANIPNILSHSLTINFTQDSDQDVCIKNEFSEVFYSTSVYPQYIGILVYPSVSNPQLVNFSFNYLALANRLEAMNLLENSIYNLIGSPVGINNVSGIIPSKFSLHQNYPNPFNPSTTIAFDLPAKSFVSLKVYNELGREIANLVNDNLNAGSYSIPWNANALESGVYFYKLVSGIRSETRKMLLIK